MKTHDEKEAIVNNDNMIGFNAEEYEELVEYEKLFCEFFGGNTVVNEADIIIDNEITETCKYFGENDCYFIDKAKDDDRTIDGYCVKEVIRQSEEGTIFFRKIGRKLATCNLNNLRKETFITSNKYKTWKSGIIDTFVGNQVLRDSNTFKLDGIKQLCEYTNPVLLLLSEMIIEDNDWDCFDTDDYLYVLKKFISAYNNGQIKTELTSQEKDSLIYQVLLNDVWHNHGLVFSLKSIYGPMEENEKERLVSELKIAAERIREKLPKDDTKEKEHKNTEKNILTFSAFLAPMIMTIAAAHVYNPFHVHNSIWKSKYEYIPLKIDGVDDDTLEEISITYSNLSSLIKYNYRLLDQQINPDALKYEIFATCMIKSICDVPVKGVDRYVQFYNMEYLLGLQYIQNISEILLSDIIEKKIAIENIEEHLFQRYGVLFQVLGHVYRESGVIARIKKTEKIIKDYIKNNVIDDIRENNSTEREYQLLRERYENYGDDEYSVGEFKIERLKTILKEYGKRVEILEQYEYEKSSAANIGRLTYKHVEAVTNEMLKDEDKKMKSIKSWIIKNVIQESFYPHVDV